MRNIIDETSRWKIFNTILVLVFSTWGMVSHNYTTKSNSFFENTVIEVFAPIQRGTMSLKESISATFDHYIFITNTSKENVKLKKKIDLMSNELFRLEEVKKENERLKSLLEFAQDIPRKKVLAQIVGWDPSNEFKVLRINKGSDDGIKLKYPVITNNGLVGYVYRVTANYSDILTIIDQNNRVDAIISRSRTHGIVEGDSNFQCRLKYVARSEKVEVGDEVISAGLGDIYPKGIKIGVVSSVNKEDFGITQSIKIEPSVVFKKLEEVLVLFEQDLPEEEDGQDE